MARGGMNDPEIGTHAAPPPPPPPVQRVNLSPVPILARARDAVAPPASLGGARTAAFLPAPRPPSLRPSLPLSPSLSSIRSPHSRSRPLSRPSRVGRLSVSGRGRSPSLGCSSTTKRSEEKKNGGGKSPKRPTRSPKAINKTQKRHRTDGRTDGRTSGRPRRHGRTDEDEGENSAVRDSGEERTNFESRTRRLPSEAMIDEILKFGNFQIVVQLILVFVSL